MPLSHDTYYKTVPFGHIIYYSVCKVTTFLHKPFYIIIKNRRDINKKKNNHKLFSLALQDGLEPTTP